MWLPVGFYLLFSDTIKVLMWLWWWCYWLTFIFFFFAVSTSPARFPPSRYVTSRPWVSPVLCDFLFWSLQANSAGSDWTRKQLTKVFFLLSSSPPIRSPAGMSVSRSYEFAWLLIRVAHTSLAELRTVQTAPVFEAIPHFLVYLCGLVVRIFEVCLGWICVGGVKPKIISKFRRDFVGVICWFFEAKMSFSALASCGHKFEASLPWLFSLIRSG